MSRSTTLETLSAILDEKYIDQTLTSKYEQNFAYFLSKHKDTLKKSLSSLEALVLLFNQLQSIKARNNVPEPPNKACVATLAELLREKNKVWPELALFNDPLCKRLHEELSANCFADFASRAEAPKTIPQLAPKFYDAKDERSFNKKFETKKLKEKQRRLKKKVTNEIIEETNYLLDKESKKQRASEISRKKKMRRIMGELQAQSKIVEKENTSLVKIRRIKKKGKRMAGSRTK